MSAKPETHLPGQSSRISTQATLTDRLGVCFQSAVFAMPWGSRWPSAASPLVAVWLDPGKQALLATTAQWSQGLLWVTATKIRIADVKTGALDICINFPPKATAVLEHG